jgi:hypothetical protein
MGRFWSMIAGEAPEPHHPSVSLMDVQKDFWRMRETKITNTKLNWLYSALIARQPIDPTHPMVNRWCCEATPGSEDIGSGCYLSMLAISLRSGITRNPKHLLPGTSLGFDYMKQGKCISGDEIGGFKVAKVNLPLPDGRLRLFREGKEDWLEEGIIVPSKKNKRERIIGEGTSTTQEGSAQQKLCATIWRNSGTVELLRWCTNASMGEWCSHAPTNFAVPSVAFAEPYAHLPQPQQNVAIIGGYAARNCDVPGF